MMCKEKFSCRFCGEKFDSKTGRNNHERSHDKWRDVVKLVQKKEYTKEEAMKEVINNG